MRKIILLGMLVVGSLFAKNVGDMLIGPYFYVGSNYKTDFVIQNTSLDKSIVVRVNFREKSESGEYGLVALLSPGDSVNATLYYSKNGVLVKSDDESWLYPLKNAQNVTKTFNRRHLSNKSFSEGYIEVLPVIAYQEYDQKKVPHSVLVDRFMEADTTNAIPVPNNLFGIVALTNTDLKSRLQLNMAAIQNASIGSPTADTIKLASPEKPTIYNNFIDKAYVESELAGDTVTAMFENYGYNDIVYFTVWGQNDNTAIVNADDTCVDSYSYILETRSLDADRPYSSSNPDPANMFITQCDVFLKNSFKWYLQDYFEYAEGLHFKEGMIQFLDFKNKDTGLRVPILATRMDAVEVQKDIYMFNWTYISID